MDRSTPSESLKGTPLDWLSTNVVNPAFNELVADPANVLVEAANSLRQRAGKGDVVKPVDRRETEPAPVGSAEYWTQTVVTGLASAAVYAAAGKLVGGASAKLFEGTALEALAAKDSVQQVVGAAAYDFARQPLEGQTRTGNLLGSIAAFSTFGLINPRLAGLSLVPRLVAQANAGVIGSVAQIGAGTLGGNQFSLHSLAQTVSTGAVMNIALPSMQHALARMGSSSISKLEADSPRTAPAQQNLFPSPSPETQAIMASPPLERSTPVEPLIKREPPAPADPNASIAHLEHVFKRNGYFTDTRQVTQISASLDAKPTGGAFLKGPAGSGKTFLTETVSQALEAKYFYKQAFPGTREENLLVDILPDQNAPSGLKEYPGVLVKAAEFLKTNPDKTALVVLDEWDKTRPSADSILLDFLQKGRLNHGSVDIQLTPQQMSRLKMFIAMNDERELSEPLLRRLPMIEFSAPDLATVKEALEFSHGQHQVIPSLLKLYERAQVAGMSKPVTVQELRQVIDAYDHTKAQGVKPDWDELIRHFVTKTDENHNLLKSSERKRIASDPPVVSRTVTNPGVSEATTSRIADLQARRRQARQPQISAIPEKLGENTAAIIPYNERNYNSAVRLAQTLSSDPSRIGDFATVVGDDSGKAIIFKKPVPLAEGEDFLAHFWGQPGEVSLREPRATLPLVRRLEQRGMQTVEADSDHLVGKFPGGDLLWTREHGAELVVKLNRGNPAKNPLAGLGIPDWYSENGQLKVFRRERYRLGQSISLGRDLPHAEITSRQISHEGLYEVRTTLSLPATASGRLHPLLRFTDPVKVGGTTLNESWGSQIGDQPMRQMQFVSLGQSWQDATNQALTQLHQDVANILLARRKHLPTSAIDDKERAEDEKALQQKAHTEQINRMNKLQELAAKETARANQQKQEALNRQVVNLNRQAQARTSFFRRMFGS